MTILPLRRLFIERQIQPEMLNFVSTEEVVALFKMYVSYRRQFSSISALLIIILQILRAYECWFVCLAAGLATQAPPVDALGPFGSRVPYALTSLL